MQNTLLYNYYDKKFKQPLLKLLREGISPHKLALTLVNGIAFGLIPVFGGTTVFCLIAAFSLRLNKPAILLINFAIYPLQLILFIPFIRMGEYIFGYTLTSMSIHELIDMFRMDWWRTLNSMWLSNLLGIFAWLIIMLPVSIALYFVILPFFKEYFENWHKNRRKTHQNQL
ncbi:MAG: DUF2062 domain-containing protein [Bacteroidales bacterium]|nr:DUF2062 domain-containing protein [Bacteroidales bacterium]